MGKAFFSVITQVGKVSCGDQYEPARYHLVTQLAHKFFLIQKFSAAPPRKECKIDSMPTHLKLCVIVIVSD